MMEPQHKRTQRIIWDQFLDPIQSLIKEALKQQGISDEDIAWTRMRWDVPDITAAWPIEKPNRNVHAWLAGEWPTYAVKFEGSAWIDDKKERKVSFYSLDPPGWEGQIVEVSTKGKLQIEIIRRPELLTKVTNLVITVAAVKDYDLHQAPSYPLPPAPFR
jgi:hypothetical protein